MYQKINYISALIALSLLTYACASYGTLGGGAKDVTPPVILKSIPVNGATHFNGKEIRITFDEYILLKDLQKQFVVSPPMKKAPVVTTKPRDIIVTFGEDLKPNTTYTFDFGNSITDNNEGNPFRKFDFVLSTGDHIDSLSILGKVLNATDHTPDKDGMYVMLYPLFEDSIPRKTLPAFIAKSDDKGWFKINHIYPGKFMIFGLKDLNMNYMFDQPGEQIAFSDTLIVFDSSYYEKPDTTTHKVHMQGGDSAKLKTQKEAPKLKPSKVATGSKLPKDTTKLDSTDFYAGKTPKVELFYFKEATNKQNLNSYNRTKNNQFNLIFELPESDSVRLKLLNKPKTSTWYQKDILRANDTLDYWITDTAIINTDTLKVQVCYYKLDSAKKSFLTYDTIKLVTKKNLAVKSSKKGQHPKPEKVTITSSLSGASTIDLNQKLYIETNQPIKTFDPSKINIIRMDDSIKIPVKFTIHKDSIFLRRYYILFNYLSDTQYKISIDSMAFINLFDSQSDSTGLNFKTQRDDYYGTIKLNLKNVICPTIVQLTTPKGELLKEKIITSSGIVIFDYLAQGKYGMKVIYDVNNNGKWDTGNWGKRLQPEKTVFYNKEISIRSSWDSEVLWELPPK